MADELEALLMKEFTDEAAFLLDQFEECCLKLEDPQARAAEMNTIFRAAHTIKGNSAALYIHDLSAFAHTVEDCLSILRSHPELIAPPVISMLLKVADAFRRRIRSLAEGRKEAADWDVSALTEDIKTITRSLQVVLNQGVPAAAPEPPRASEPVAAVAATAVAPGGAPKTPQNEEKLAVRVDATRLDAVLDIVGELVVIKSQLLEEVVHPSEDPARRDSLLDYLDKAVRDLQDRTLYMRMTPLKPLFLKLQRAVRDLSVQLGKPVDFSMAGMDIETDRNMIELLSDPLLHIVRNSVDHGIEATDARRSAGKAEKARISVSADQLGGRIIWEIRDDGRGIHRDKVLAKAIEKGVLSREADAAALSDREVHELLFAPGFSTAEKVTEISGRGVGLDVVKANIGKLRGSVEIESAQGKGTTFRLAVPLSATIMDGIVVLVDSNRYVVSMDRIQELIEARNLVISSLYEKGDAVTVHGRTLPLVDLKRVLVCHSGGAAPRKEHFKSFERDMVMIVDRLGATVALRIDGVLGQSQIVVKPVGEQFKGDLSVSGAAVMGDGEVALVLNIDGITHSVAA